MIPRRLTKLTSATKKRVLERDGYTCVYCGEPTNGIDHVMPVSYRVNDHPSNLVACCLTCNMIAGDKWFPDLEAKKAHIRERLSSPEFQDKPRTTYLQSCADCWEPFLPGVSGATILLCPRCAALADLEPMHRPEPERKTPRYIVRHVKEDGTEYEATTMPVARFFGCWNLLPSAFDDGVDTRLSL